jgi:formate C-acetyltransferase
MTVEAPSRDAVNSQDPWEGFTPGPWRSTIDVRDFILANFTPYTGDASFLSRPDRQDAERVGDPAARLPLGRARQARLRRRDPHPRRRGRVPRRLHLRRRRRHRRPADRHPAQASDDAGRRLAHGRDRHQGGGLEPDERVKEIFTKYRKTHNEAVFDIYTPRIRAARSSHLVTGLPDAYGRGRIIGDYRRVALYGVDALIEAKEADKDSVADQPFSENWARYREEHSEQIKALKKLKNLGRATASTSPAPRRPSTRPSSGPTWPTWPA